MQILNNASHLRYTPCRVCASYLMPAPFIVPHIIFLMTQYQFKPSTSQDSHPFILSKIPGNMKVAKISILSHHHHQMIYVLNIKNGVSISLKVHKYQNIISEMQTIPCV